MLADGGKQPQRAFLQLSAISLQLSAPESEQSYSEILFSLAEG